MSRIGRKPIPVPAGVTVAIEPERVTVNGPKGELSERIHRDITVAQEGEELVVTRPTDRGEHRALHGLTRSLVAKMVEGVTAGFEKRLEIQGVGCRAQLKGKGIRYEGEYVARKVGKRA
jgi:large subunit ribosomal protein L6